MKEGWRNHPGQGERRRKRPHSDGAGLPCSAQQFWPGGHTSCHPGMVPAECPQARPVCVTQIHAASPALALHMAQSRVSQPTAPTLLFLLLHSPSQASFEHLETTRAGKAPLQQPGGNHKRAQPHNWPWAAATGRAHTHSTAWAQH